LGGGPESTSYRNIELLRDNKVYRIIDIYHFLVNGDQSDNVGLKDNDVIRFRPTIKGLLLKVKRPGIFEMKRRNFADLLNFASGFNEFAYTVSVNVLQKNSQRVESSRYKVKRI
jgi:protein involved in polysaccharide export with SLBB domain